MITQNSEKETNYMSDNPLLAGLKLPGRIFQLPSKGLFYKSGEISSDQTEGEIHVKALSAFDEITLKNADQLFSGDALKTVFPKCTEGIDKPVELLSKDVDALLLYLRLVTYGPSYEYTAKHTCENAKVHSYVADLDKMVNDIKYVDATLLDDEYKITLVNGQVVRLRPLQYKHVMNIVKNNQNKTEISVEDARANLRALVLGVVDSVDGTVNRDHIAEWAMQLSTPMINKIASKIEILSEWGVNNVVECECKDCGAKFKVEIPLNPVTFFTE